MHTAKVLVFAFVNWSKPFCWSLLHVQHATKNTIKKFLQPTFMAASLPINFFKLLSMILLATFNACDFWFCFCVKSNRIILFDFNNVTFSCMPAHTEYCKKQKRRRQYNPGKFYAYCMRVSSVLSLSYTWIKWYLKFGMPFIWFGFSFLNFNYDENWTKTPKKRRRIQLTDNMPSTFFQIFYSDNSKTIVPPCRTHL